MVQNATAQPIKDYTNLAHPLSYGEQWRCPITGFVIEKTEVENERQRTEILAKCKIDRHYRSMIMSVCRRSFVVWCNLFAFTYRVNEVVDGATVPIESARSCAKFITWPIQDAAAKNMLSCMERGRDLCIDKSRDMGASWLVLAVFVWLWLFRPQTQLFMISIELDLVDQAENRDSLFWKIDFLFKRLPRWMKPSFRRTSMMLVNKTNGSTIVGDATTKDAGRGGRHYAMLIDEAAANKFLSDIILASSKSASCRLYVSTPKGPGAYSEVRFSGIPVQVMGYWDHPEKGAGRELRHHPKFNRTIWWSPYFEHEEHVRMRSMRDLAQNDLCDHEHSGSMVFDAPVINHQLATYAVRPPAHVGNLRVKGEMEVDRRIAVSKGGNLKLYEWLEDATRGRLRLWIPLIKDENGFLRPRQDRIYAMGADVSWGLGASNSAISFGDVETRTKVGEWTDSNASPQDMAILAAAMGRWFGGVRGCAFMSWETNGPGGGFTRAMKELRYPWLDRNIQEGMASDDSTERLGWVSNPASKLNILEELRGDMASDTFRNPSPEALQEASRFVFYQTGTEVGPAHLESLPGNEKRTHGDRVIADAVLNRAMKRCPRIRPTEPVIAYGSRAWREQQKKKAEEAWDIF